MSTASVSHRSGAGMAGLVADLSRPYRGWLVVILGAMLVEAVAGLAGPWPLKIVIDDVVGYYTVPAWAGRLLGPALAADGRTLAAVAAGSLVLIAGLGGLASYVHNYYTESVGQWVANDLRLRVYDHLECLSFYLLRHAPDRCASQHNHRRRRHRAGFRVVVHAQHAH
jgi:ABC-type multidrug transport system fused ATPase/permease subunit